MTNEVHVIVFAYSTILNIFWCNILLLVSHGQVDTQTDIPYLGIQYINAGTIKGAVCIRSSSCIFIYIGSNN